MPLLQACLGSNSFPHLGKVGVLCQALLTPQLAISLHHIMFIDCSQLQASRHVHRLQPSQDMFCRHVQSGHAAVQSSGLCPAQPQNT